jgi:hypothetical protein
MLIHSAERKVRIQLPPAGSPLRTSENRATQMALVRHDSALFQDQLQAPYIGDVLERIGGDHNQVGELAHLHCPQFGADAAHLSAMACGCSRPAVRAGTSFHRDDTPGLRC